MTALTDIQFTPSQLAELDRLDPQLVDDWLTVMNATPGVKSPAGWLLAAVRTGPPPKAATDVRERLAVQRAERLIRNTGANIPTEHELVETLFHPPDLTADVHTLEQIDRELTGDQRALLGPALAAQLAYTRTHGRQRIPETGGTLHHHDTPKIRQRITDLWRTERTRLLDAEAAARARADQEAHAAAEATETHDPDEPPITDLWSDTP